MTPQTTHEAIHGNIQRNYDGAWRAWMEGLEQTLNEVDECLGGARDVQEVCTDEWCEATDRLLDELNHTLFSISEPRWTSDEDSQKIKELRKRARSLYSEFDRMVKK
ncbi:MAG: hypothetical protein ACOCVZ_03795 [Gemmatimonadota bacterium]